MKLERRSPPERLRHIAGKIRRAAEIEDIRKRFVETQGLALSLELEAAALQALHSRIREAVDELKQRAGNARGANWEASPGNALIAAASLLSSLLNEEEPDDG